MAGYVDPFEEFKKKKEEAAKKAAAPAPSAPASSAPASPAKPAAAPPPAAPKKPVAFKPMSPPGSGSAPVASPAPAAAPSGGLEFVTAKPAGLGDDRHERKSLQDIEAELVRPKIESELEYQQGGGNVQTLGAEQVAGELTIKLEHAGHTKEVFPASDIQVGDAKPSGMQSHRHEKVEAVEPGERPAGFEQVSSPKRNEGESDEEVPEKPSGFSKY